MSTDNIELSYTEYGTEHGNGEPIVITHGLFGMGRNWTPVAKKLAESHHVFLVDLRNHGQSPWADDMTYPVMAADLAQFIDQHDLAPATVIGHSMGGKTAMALALNHPELVLRLVIADIAPVPYEHEFTTILNGMSELDLSAFERRGQAQTQLAKAIDDATLAGFLIHNLRHTDEDGFSWRLNLEAIHEHMDDLLDFPIYEADEAYEGKTLFLAGERSTYIRPWHHVEIERLFTASSIEFIENAGHWIHAEQPATVTKKLLAFLG